MTRPSFTAHPASVGETYAEHMHTAAWFGGKMLLGAGACFVHALLPFLFTRTGSATVTELHDRMVVNRVRAERAAGLRPADGLPS